MVKKIKSYYERNKEKRRAYQRAYLKRTNYETEKTPYQRALRNVKRMTRYYFPLKNKRCGLCGKKAEEHHHTSNPAKIRLFKFLCHKCHVKLHRRK